MSATPRRAARQALTRLVEEAERQATPKLKAGVVAVRMALNVPEGGR